MNNQHYGNHRKYYPLHHFIFLPIMGAACFIGFYKGISAWPDNIAWLLFGCSSFFILLLSVMLRQHYALGNQDRIIRLEFRLRYFELYGKPSTEVEQQLSFGQMAALRFAPDDEFKHLLQKKLTEKLSANAIKKSIKNWQGDYMRV